MSFSMQIDADLGLECVDIAGNEQCDVHWALPFSSRGVAVTAAALEAQVL
jgi:hypothetical protein